jgi:archaemetzincin
VSTYRLDESIYGFPPNPRLTQERLLKESLHELGHTFGLIHCPDYLCVMHSSTSVEEIDVKTARFCLKCQGILEKKLA